MDGVVSLFIPFVVWMSCSLFEYVLRTVGFLGTGDEMGRLCLHATWTVPGFRS